MMKSSSPSSTPRRPMPTSSTRSTRSTPPLPPTYDEVYEDAPINQGLLSHKRKSIRDRAREEHNAKEWLRPYWLGSSLFLLLFGFWLLDSLKDPTFAKLVQGNLDRHQPPAKLCSVVTTLILVCLMEYWTNRQQAEAARQEAEGLYSDEQVLDAGGVWQQMNLEERRMSTNNKNQRGQLHSQPVLDDSVSIDMFLQVGLPYVVAFGILAYLLAQFEKTYDTAEMESDPSTSTTFNYWYVVAYILYATIESFGSIAVATFWSFTNSTLNLDDAENYYGPIIATAQLGAIGGSTLVARNQWETPQLLVVVSLVIVLQVVVMKLYHRRFQPTSVLAAANNDDDAASIMTWQDHNDTVTKPFWSGIYLIFRHYYVLLILGVSCLYEISMTCLDYQMKLLGYAKFETNGHQEKITFSEFMGRYGQVVNVISLFFSSLIFPWLIRRYGLRVTLRLFPSFLLVVTVIAYGALPGNLTVLFLSLSILKAMTYSIHDPAKEILYIPTSNAIKFRAKFWIDVVGERISKAVGSGFNTYAGSVDRSVRIAGLPSLLSAAGLWFVCYYVGKEFDRLLRRGRIVGLGNTVDPTTYRKVSAEEHQTNDESDEPSEVEIDFASGDSVSTLDITGINSEFPIQIANVADTPTGKVVELKRFRK